MRWLVVLTLLCLPYLVLVVRGDDDEDGAPQPPSKPAIATRPSAPSDQPKQSSGGNSKPDANDSKPSSSSSPAPVGKGNGGGKTPLSSGGRAGKPIAGGKSRGKGKGSKVDDDDLDMLDDENYWKGLQGGGSGSGGSGGGGFGGGPVDPYGPNMFNGWGYYNINRYPTRLDRPRSMWDDSSAHPLGQALKVIAVPLAIVCAVLAF